MSLAINTAVPSSIENAGMDLRSAALNQAATATDATTSPVTLTAVDPQVASARLAKYIHATDTNFHTGEDAKNVANAQFDFHLDNGSIQVTSGSLSDSDKTWLQNLLNGNSALVQAANTFRRDAVGGYSERAEADGNPVTKAQSDALGQQVDQTTNFMQLFQQISAKGAKFVSTGGGTLYASNGAKMDFSQSPGNAVGFLAFMQSTTALESGADKYVESNGRVSYGAFRGDMFAQSMVPDFYPSRTTSIGVHETA
jgi:hypothetical protein